ncbi:hydrolase [Salinigranum sp. GCM10025319]|uniref:hydrolase n=1 Tax=Salinigranum sp. GCM10025319 TaxID=3252687 RepID=UPI00360E0A03
MDFAGWASDSVGRIRADGIDGVRESLRPVYHKSLQGISRLRDPGTPIYERDWDLLIVVDACRLDLVREVAPAYDYIDGVGSLRSLDSMTLLWMLKNFVPVYAEEMSETAYVCGNPFSAEALDADDFLELDEVWEYVWEDPGTVPPRAITDRTIAASREHQPERLIAHYMQPHCPFLSRPNLTRGKRLDKFGHQEWDDVWQKLQAGKLTRDEVWAGYRENLELALDDIELLLENVDAENVVITSDHGNALGERWVYGHPPGMPMDCLRVVPWIETTAVDRETYEPETEVQREEEMDREEQLAALGYV